jgi:hypothetical protein
MKQAIKIIITLIIFISPLTLADDALILMGLGDNTGLIISSQPDQDPSLYLGFDDGSGILVDQNGDGTLVLPNVEFPELELFDATL